MHFFSCGENMHMYMKHECHMALWHDMECYIKHECHMALWQNMICTTPKVVYPLSLSLHISSTSLSKMVHTRPMVLQLKWSSSTYVQDDSNDPKALCPTSQCIKPYSKVVIPHVLSVHPPQWEPPYRRCLTNTCANYHIKKCAPYY